MKLKMKLKLAKGTGELTLESEIQDHLTTLLIYLILIFGIQNSVISCPPKFDEVIPVMVSLWPACGAIPVSVFSQTKSLSQRVT